MVRRSLRLGLWAGLLLGVAAAVVKTVQGRRDGKELTSPPPDRWAPAPPAEESLGEPANDAESGEAGWGGTQPAREPAHDAKSGEAGWGGTQPARDERLREEPEVEPRPPRLVKSVPAGEAPATKPGAAPRKTVAAAKRVADTAKRTPAAKATTWVRPVDGVCPPTHPVKGKLASRLFHLPGMFAYDRTRADRCYVSEAAAVADGLTRAKR